MIITSIEDFSMNLSQKLFFSLQIQNWRVPLIPHNNSKIEFFYKLICKSKTKKSCLTIIRWLIISTFLLSTGGFIFINNQVIVQPQSFALEPKIKGMTINAWNSEAYNSSDFDVSITNLANLKANWVTFTVFWFMEHYNDTEIHPRTDLYTASNSSLVHAIQKAHELNMKVALKPMVDVLDGKWRGDIEPYNWTLWFENYRKFISFYADFAQNYSVELFIVGTEFRSSQTYETEWRQVINNVRIHFDGNLTYAANWDSFSNYSVLPKFAVKFWDALDYIGVDAYFPLTNSFNPTVQQLENAWSNSGSGWWGSGRNWTNQLYSTYNSTSKKIIFTEIGYCSQNGTNTQPWNYNVSLTKDLQEQADCYQAALEVFKNATWFEGWFWWGWETDPNAGKPGTPDEKKYTPQNKPAQEVLRQYYYEVPPDIAILDLVASETIVEKGLPVEINVTVENQGIYTENFNLTIYANETIIYEENLNLENQSSTTLTFTWNTSNVLEATYILEAFVPPLPREVDVNDNLYTDGTVTIGNHDIAIIGLTVSNNIIHLNKTITINVTLKNNGVFNETFQFILNYTYSIDPLIGKQNITLLPQDTIEINYTWEPPALGRYMIEATVSNVSKDINLLNNTKKIYLYVIQKTQISNSGGSNTYKIPCLK